MADSGRRYKRHIKENKQDFNFEPYFYETEEQEKKAKFLEHNPCGKWVDNQEIGFWSNEVEEEYRHQCWELYAKNKLQLDDWIKQDPYPAQISIGELNENIINSHGSIEVYNNRLIREL